jgi:uncharacterized membrane protein
LFIAALQHIQSLQSVAGDGHDRKIARGDAAVSVQAGSHRGGDASGGFGEDSFGFG